MNQKVFVIGSNSENLKPLREKIRSFLKKTGLPVKTQEEILVAICEGCTNSMRHAYLGKPGNEIRVTAQDREGEVVLKIRDYGKKIDLSKVKTPELPSQKPGGLGIYFMKTIMDELQYNTTHPQGNELILVKYKKGNKKGEKGSTS